MFDPTPLNLPRYPFRIHNKGNQYYIFDEIRRKFLLLTPEEWVRQNLIKYLIEEKKYPRTLFNLEGGLRLNTLKKRTDILIFDLKGEKKLLVECKAPTVRISQKTFDQIARYNIVHKVPLLLVSNGLQHYTCKINFEEESYEFISELPDYKIS